jgi:glucosamine--fructose-6-phosphate aminotransferase (isomerizing)
MSIMADEIAEQPEAIRRTIEGERSRLAAIAARIERYAPTHVVIAARGTSDNAATYAKYLWGIANGLPVLLDSPSLTTLYQETRHLRRALVVGISQSGESTDVVEVIRAGQREGALTLGITSDGASSLAAAAQEVALCHTGIERAVAATKTYTTQLAVLSLLSSLLAGDTELQQVLRLVPEAMARVLEQRAAIGETAQSFVQRPACVVLGRGFNYSTALETALKLKETCYLWAEPYSTADFHHGPIALVEEGTPVLAYIVPGRAFDNMVQAAATLSTRGADLVVFGTMPSQTRVHALVSLPERVDAQQIPESLTPLISIVAGQIFACELAQARGYNPDQPRGLTKITRTL